MVDVHIELSDSLPWSQVGSVDSNDITESVDDWDILESLGVDDDLSVVLLTLGVEVWVDDLEGADKSVWLDLVWESGINDDTIEVAWLGGSEGGLGELNVVVEGL